ncbi:MAG: type 4a pilus biogenesis protein PilO [Gemmatimonadetes bacterium]|nr:type 4a pilus biogenesis protein PilO [Gemmatimonadota bacterium]
MAVLPQDVRGQSFLALTVLAVSCIYFLYAGTPIGGVRGVKQLGVTRDSLQVQIDSTEEKVRTARRDVQRGAVRQLEQRLAEYRATLDLMRQLVPLSGEVPNLLDDISSRAKIRGANVVNFVPQPVESGSPFDTQRFRFTVTGQYDQIGEFLSDVASLPRIIVPYDVKLERIQSPTADTALLASGRLLQASFQIRTYVKPPVTDTTGTPSAPGTPGAAARGAANE